MKHIVINTLAVNNRRFFIVVVTDGKITETHEATLGTVTTVRNKLCDRLSSEPDVATCTAPRIPFPFDYEPTGRGAWGGGRK